MRQTCEPQDGQYGHGITVAADDLDVDGQAVRYDAVETESDSEEHLCIVRSATLPHIPSMSHRRGIDLNIPQFNQIANSPSPSAKLHASSGVDCNLRKNGLPESTLTQTTHPQLFRSHSLGPLTPPHDTEVRWWPKNSVAQSSTEAEHDSADQTPMMGGLHETGKGLSLTQASISQTPANTHTPFHGSSRLPWLDQALRSISRYGHERSS